MNSFLSTALEKDTTFQLTYLLCSSIGTSLQPAYALTGVRQS